MSPEEAREAMIDAWVYAWWGPNVEIEPTLRASVAKKLDYATAAGFSISLASVRDHTNCQTCEGVEFVCDSSLIRKPNPCDKHGCLMDRRPCPGGSAVVWSTEA